VIKQAINDGLIKFRKSGEFLSLKNLDTAVLNEFLHNPFVKDSNAHASNCQPPLAALFENDETDAAASILYLESILARRAGILAAGVLCGIANHTGAGFNPFAPLRIAVEGTTYLRFYGLKESIEASFYSVFNRRSPRFAVISPVEQASLYGAAAAALST